MYIFLLGLATLFMLATLIAICEMVLENTRKEKEYPIVTIRNTNNVINRQQRSFWQNRKGA